MYILARKGRMTKKEKKVEKRERKRANVRLSQKMDFIARFPAI